MLFEENNEYNSLSNFVNLIKESINCELPAQIESVNGNFVNVRMIRNDIDKDIIISNVPVKMPETQRAYIFLGLAKGDRGTITFYDKSLEGYIRGEETYNGDDRCHSLQDRTFSLGFVPNTEAFIYPQNTDIEIGLKDQTAKISFVSGSITINTTNANINAENINSSGNWKHTGNISLEGDLDVTGATNLKGDTTIQEKPFLSHAHSNGNNGSPTGGVI